MLPALEREFAAAVFDNAEAFNACVKTGRFSAAQHVQVYRNNVFESLSGALAAVYPVVRRLVGHGFFAYVAHEYILKHRPRSGNLHDFGMEFSSFLAGFAPAQSLPYLPDVAKLEWNWHLAYNAPDAPPFNPEKLKRLNGADPTGVGFTLHPSAYFLVSTYPILTIWLANQEDAPDQTVDLARCQDSLLIVRRDLEVEVERLTWATFVFLSALSAGQRLAEAASSALTVDDGFELEPALRDHLTRGTIIDLI